MKLKKAMKVWQWILTISIALISITIELICVFSELGETLKKILEISSATTLTIDIGLSISFTYTSTKQYYLGIYQIQENTENYDSPHVDTSNSTVNGPQSNVGKAETVYNYFGKDGYDKNNAKKQKKRQQYEELTSHLSNVSRVENMVEELAYCRKNNMGTDLLKKTSEIISYVKSSKNEIAPILRDGSKSQLIVECCNIIEGYYDKVIQLTNSYPLDSTKFHLLQIQMMNNNSFYSKFDSIYEGLKGTKVSLPPLDEED